MIFYSLVSLLPPLFIRDVYDQALGGETFSSLKFSFLLLLLLYLSKALFKGGQSLFGYICAKNMEKDMRQEVFSRVLRLPLRFFDQTRTGQVLSRLTSDIEWIQSLAFSTLQEIFVSVLTFLGSAWFLFYLHPKLAGVAFLPLPALFVLSFFVGRRMRRLFVTIREQIGELTSVIENFLAGIRTVKVHQKYRFAEEAVEKEQEALLATRLKLIPVSASYASLVPFFNDLGIFLILFFGLYFFFQGKATPGDIFAFTFYLRLLYDPVLRLSTLFESIQRAFAGMHRLAELLQTKEENDGTVKKSLQGKVVVENLCFGYCGDPFLQKISFQLEPGEKCALVGPSGTGKTSLALLLVKAYEPLSGKIFIDHVPLSQWSNASLREQVGVVLQGDYLFFGTIRENLLFARSDATEKMMWEALSLACADEFVKRLPQKLDTPLGERGVRLSAGEQQRLCLARALLMNPKLLILDEATSNLDLEKEFLIQQALLNALEGRTAIVIAHRPTTVRLCQKVLVLEPQKFFFGTVQQALRESLYFQKFYQRAYEGLYV